MSRRGVQHSRNFERSMQSTWAIVSHIHITQFSPKAWWHRSQRLPSLSSHRAIWRSCSWVWGDFFEMIFDLKVRTRISKWKQSTLSHQLTSCANIVPNMDPTWGLPSILRWKIHDENRGFHLWWVELVWLWLELVWLDLESNTGVEVSSVLRTMLGSRINGDCWICKSTLCPPWNKKKSHSRKRVIDDEPDLGVLPGSLLTFTLYHLIWYPAFHHFSQCFRTCHVLPSWVVLKCALATVMWSWPMVLLSSSALVSVCWSPWSLFKQSLGTRQYFGGIFRWCHMYVTYIWLYYIRDSFTVPFCCLFIYLLIDRHKN